MGKPFALLLTVLLAAAPAAAERIRLERGDGPLLRMHWLPAPGPSGPRPAVVAMHGCGGLYARDDVTFDRRYAEYSEHLHRAGYHVLLPDSFGSRGARAICTVPNGVDPRGVHQGGNPQARAQSRQEVDTFLARILQ